MASQLNLLDHEAKIRFGIFFGILTIMTLWEIVAPCRRPSAPKTMRWFSNVGLLVLGTAVLRTLFPMAAVGVAAIADEHQWGMFQSLQMPYWQTVVFSIVILDFITYLQHILFHALPALWRLHRVHHVDLDFDVTTGLRFHPLELLLSMAGKLTVVLLLGPPMIAVLLFEVILNATSMFNHGNVSLPDQIDRYLRWFIVTPDMHRIHHSIITQETNSNYGFNLPWWDYILGTYRHRPSVSHTDMTIGLAEYQKDLRAEQLPWMLVLPFLNHPTSAKEGVSHHR
ncbi:MAG: sterol desaturase family protein [Cyanobacteria bacterium P01_H01_bin.21]